MDLGQIFIVLLFLDLSVAFAYFYVHVYGIVRHMSHEMTKSTG